MASCGCWGHWCSKSGVVPGHLWVLAGLPVQHPPCWTGIQQRQGMGKGKSDDFMKKKRDKSDLIKNTRVSFNLKAVTSLLQHVLGVVRWWSGGSRMCAACPAVGLSICSHHCQGMFQPGEEGRKVCSSKWCDLTLHRKGKRYGHFFGFR